jgi:transposase
MRGRREPQVTMLAFVDLEERVPVDHPLRAIKRLADDALADLSPTFDAMYRAGGRPSIAPERLLKASLLIALYSVRSERAFCEELDYQLLFRWFLDMTLLEPSFDSTSFTKNRGRLLEHAVGQRLFDEVVLQAQEQGLLSDEHFAVDGTLIEACASLKSFRRRDDVSPPPPDDPGNPSVDFHGERRANATHQSTIDPEARLLKKGKGKEAKLSFMGHALMENRNGLLVDFQLTPATGTAERDAVPDLLDAAVERGFHPKTLGSDKNYDPAACVADQRVRGVTPHVAQNTRRKGGSAIDGRTTRHPGYTVSQRIRKRVEEIFGWMKTVGGFRRTRYRGLAVTRLAGYLVATAYNLVRLSRLATAAQALPTAS